MEATTTETQQYASDRLDERFESDLQHMLSLVRSVNSGDYQLDKAATSQSIPALLSRYSTALKDVGKLPEAEAFENVREKVVDKKAFGGLGLNDYAVPTPAEQAETLFLVEAWLEAINSRERARNFLTSRPSPAEGTRPMTLAEKVFAQHAVGEKPPHGLAAGDVVRVGIDWILASELSWSVRVVLD